MFESIVDRGPLPDDRAMGDGGNATRCLSLRSERTISAFFLTRRPLLNRELTSLLQDVEWMMARCYHGNTRLRLLSPLCVKCHS